MSETSFDTSAADTLTSGLSLGQCIKNAAEEFQQSENWYELQPTVEKEWHTLQGEVTSQITLGEDELSELPISDMSNSSIDQVKREPLNPISRLFDHVKVHKASKQHPYAHSSSQYFASTSEDLCTPHVAVRNRPFKLHDLDGYPQEQFVTPAVTDRGKNKISSQFSAPKTSLPGEHAGKTGTHQRSSESDNLILSAQNISNLLEQDDSLAQRVKDLLEDSTSARSAGSENTLTKEEPSKQGIPTLLQQDSPIVRSSASSTVGLQARGDYSQDDRIILSDTSLYSASDKTTETKVAKQISTEKKALDTFNGSRLEVENLSSNALGIGDTLESLNTSRGTEYGDLPESVDIPHGIIERLTNMRALDKESHKCSTHSLPKNAWNEQKESNPIPQLSSTSRTENGSKAPIAGDVQYYTGSNPTTPHIPVEEDKLQQLQKYIEKKTGMPSISPLTDVSVSAPSVPSAKSEKSIHLVAAPHQAYTDSKKLLVEGKGSNTTASLYGVVSTKETPEQRDVEGLSCENTKKQSGARAWEEPSNSPGATSPLDPIEGVKRSEPEGMSPPISNSQVSTSNVNAITSGGGAKQSPIDQSLMKSTSIKVKDESYLDESLADESLLARIKSALSDSFSQRPLGSSCQATGSGMEKSDISFASSIDSLAVQVKALLEEELPQVINADNDAQDTSNLSEAIQHFENTDLWKFVAQFLPSALGSNMSSTSLPVNLNDTSSTVNANLPVRDNMGDSGMHEDNSVEVHSSPHLPGSEVGVQDGEARSYVSPIKSTSAPSVLGHTPVKSESLHSIKSSSFFSRSSEHCDDMANETLKSTGKATSFNPIPGIPQFSQSVVSNERDLPIYRNTENPPSTDTPQVSAQEKSFSHYTKNANDVLSTQLDRVAHRNFDVSLTPARHASLFNQEHAKIPKLQNNETSNELKSAEVKAHEENRKSMPSKPPYIPRNKNSPSSNIEASKHEQKSASAVTPPTEKETISTKSSVVKDLRLVSGSSYFSSSPYDRPQTDEGKPALPTSFSKRSTVAPTPSQREPVEQQRPHESLVKSRHRSSIPVSSERRVRIDECSSVKENSPGKSRKSRSPLRDRITIEEWLRSPERHKSLERSKRLPTFKELMQEEAKKEYEEKKEREKNMAAEKPLDTFLTSKGSSYLKEMHLNNQTGSRVAAQTRRRREEIFPGSEIQAIMQSGRFTTEEEKQHQNLSCPSLQNIDAGKSMSFPDKSESHAPAEFESSSMRPHLDINDSYQEASLNTAGLPSVALNSSLKTGFDSDLDIHRRFLNPTSSSDTDRRNKFITKYKIPHNLNEFQSLDPATQKEVLKRILGWVNRKSGHSRSVERASSVPLERKQAKSLTKRDPNISLASNQAVCDSDSTEYFDLPSTRPSTAQTRHSNSQHVDSLNETKAEEVIKRLLEKIKHQKMMERAAKKKSSHKRNVATSSTPQRSRPPMVVPEASSIASTTDTDVSEKHLVKQREKKYYGNKKVTYIQEVSESEPPIQVARRHHRKSQPTHAGRIVLCNRSVQTSAAEDDSKQHDVATNVPSPVKRSTSERKSSKAVQTAFTRAPSDRRNEGVLNGETTLKDNNEDDDKENIGVKVSDPPQRFSSFFVNAKKDGAKKNGSSKPEKQPVHKSVAWYEPFRYEPHWMQPVQKQESDGLVQLSLQEALANQHPEFISKSRERQRRITINSNERQMQEIWAEERQRLFGVNQKVKPKRRRSEPPPPRKSVPLTRRQIIAETRQKFEHLPEVVKRKRDEERKREYASYRLKAQLYKKKVQNKVLGRYFMN